MTKHSDDLRPRVRALEVISIKLQQTVWLSRFTLGAVLTLSLAGGVGISRLGREVSSVKQDVSWLVRMQKEGRNDSAPIGHRVEFGYTAIEAASADSTRTITEGSARGGLAGITSTKGRTHEWITGATGEHRFECPRP